MRLAKFTLPLIVLSLCNEIEAEHLDFLKIYKNRFIYSRKIPYHKIKLFNGEYLKIPHFTTIAHPFCSTIRAGNTLLVHDKDFANTLKLGTVYLIDKSGKCIHQLDMGKITITDRSGRLKIVKSKFLWAFNWMKVETNIVYNPEKNKIKTIAKFTREYFIDYLGRKYIKLSLQATGYADNKMIELIFNFPSKFSPQCLILFKESDSKIYNISAFNHFSIKCPLGNKRRYWTFFILSSQVPSVKKGEISKEEISLQRIINKTKPLSGIKTALARWCNTVWPPADFPDPWLNKLWLANILAIQSLVSQKSPKGFTYLTLCYLKDLDYLLDARWSRDTRYTVGTILDKLKNDSLSSTFRTRLVELIPHALINSPEPDIYKFVKILPTTHNKKANTPFDYDSFNGWMRNQMIGGDYDFPAGVWITPEGYLQYNAPKGVIDRILTKLIGLNVDDNPKLHISPSKLVKTWSYFAITNLPYKSHILTIVWQKKSHYKRYTNCPLGFSIYVDGKLVSNRGKLEDIRIDLNESK